MYVLGALAVVSGGLPVVWAIAAVGTGQIIAFGLLALVGVMVTLYATTDDPRYASSRVLNSPHQHFTWVGFATFVTVCAGASLTFVTNIADFCRYTRSRRDVAIGFYSSSLVSIVVTTF